MGTTVKIEKSGVKEALKKSKDSYEDTVQALNGANAVMKGLHTYWGGNLYNEIVTAWNNIYPTINTFLENAKKAYNFMSGALKVYTTADIQKIDMGTVKTSKLTGLETKDSDNLDATTSKLRADGVSTVRHISTAISQLTILFNSIVNSPASSDAINEAKNYMKANKAIILNGLQDVSSIVSKNINTAADRFDAAEEAVKNATE